MAKKALAGVKVLEWAQFVAGPYSTKLLADLGAEVIKIEKPKVGDEARRRGPFPGDIPHPERSGLFLYLNTNKLGITLDVEDARGRRLFQELVKQADVLVEDNPPRVVKELGLDYESLSELSPKLIMTSISPFGQTGPYRDLKAYHLNTYHGGGLGYLTPDGLFHPPRQPLKAGGFFGEYACGLISTVATLGALYAQRITGLGQQVDVSKQEAILSLCMVQVARYPNEGVIQTRFERARGYGDIFPCKNGHIVEMTNEEYQWRGLVELMGNPEWGEDERYKVAAFRESHYKQLAQSITQWMANHSKEEIYHRGQALGCAISPVMTAEEILNSEQLKARGFFVEIDHPEAGRIRYPSAPYQFSGTPWAVARSAPLLGQHNEEVYCERLDFSQREVEEMKAAGSRGDESGGNHLKREYMDRGALQGIRIIDFTWAWAGAYTTELLAFMGAEVIKVESMKHTDHTRLRAFTTGQKFESLEESYVFNHVNLNKLGIRLNLSQPKGVELARELISISDVVAQNMRPGVMERLGLGYETLKEIKPDIIYLSSSTRGSSGPERGYIGYAPNFGALGGISYITGYADAGPNYMRGEVDLLSGITGAFAILAALHHRLETGEGQHIDLSSTEAISVLIGEVFMDYTMNGRVQSRRGNDDEIMAPHNCYRCKGEDKWISIAVSTEEEWKAFCHTLGNPGWSKEERFSSATDRRQNKEDLDRLVEEWTINYIPREVMEALQKVGVAAIPSFNAEELFHDPHLGERRCWAKVYHPVMKEQTVVAPPWKLSATPAKVSRPAPLIGEHSHYVFGELLGLSPEEISRLEEEKVIY